MNRLMSDSFSPGPWNARGRQVPKSPAAGAANADRRLVAGVVAAPDATRPTDGELTAHLAASLPDQTRP